MPNTTYSVPEKLEILIATEPVTIFNRWLHDRGDNYLDARRDQLPIRCFRPISGWKYAQRSGSYLIGQGWYDLNLYNLVPYGSDDLLRSFA